MVRKAKQDLVVIMMIDGLKKDKEGKSLKKEWKDADGNKKEWKDRRVHEKDKRKDKKHNVMDSYRQMWEDANRQMTYKRLQFLEKNSKKLKRVIQLK